jgi:hypothetical protein
MPNEKTTVPVPPRAVISSDLEETKLVEIPDVEPKDPAEVQIQTFRLVRRVALQQDSDRKQAAADRLQWQSLGKAVETLRVETGQRFEAVESRLGHLETDRLEAVAGVRPSTDVAPSIPSLPPMRPQMNTHESLHAVALRQEVLDVKQDKQTSMIEQGVKLAKDQLQAKREGNARLVGIAVGALVLYILQNCAIPHLRGAPAPAPTAITATALPPATK